MKLTIIRILYIFQISMLIIGCTNNGRIDPMSYQVAVLDSIKKYPPGSPVEKWGRLKVNTNNKLCDSNGNPRQLRGISAHCLQWEGIANITKQNIDFLAEDWRCNLFRIVVCANEEGGYVYNRNHKYRYVENAVRWCGENGIYCIVCWYVVHPGNPQDTLYRNYKEDDGKKIDLAGDFFTYCAHRFKKQKHVIYELCNLPNGGDSAHTVTWKDHIKPYCEEMYNIIRKCDEEAVIICGTPDYSRDIQQVIDYKPIKNKNLMYCLSTSGNNVEKSDSIKTWSEHLPIFVTTFSTVKDAIGDSSFYFDKNASIKWLKAIDDGKISWCNWALVSESVAQKCGALQWNTGNIKYDINRFESVDSVLSKQSGIFIWNRLRFYDVRDSILREIHDTIPYSWIPGKVDTFLMKKGKEKYVYARKELKK